MLVGCLGAALHAPACTSITMAKALSVCVLCLPRCVEYPVVAPSLWTSFQRSRQPSSCPQATNFMSHAWYLIPRESDITKSKMKMTIELLGIPLGETCPAATAGCAGSHVCRFAEFEHHGRSCTRMPAPVLAAGAVLSRTSSCRQSQHPRCHPQLRRGYNQAPRHMTCHTRRRRCG